MIGIETQIGRRLVTQALEVGFSLNQIEALARFMTNITQESQAYAGTLWAGSVGG